MGSTSGDTLQSSLKPKEKGTVCSETPRAAGHADHQVLALDRLREEVAQDDAPQQSDVARAASLHTQEHTAPHQHTATNVHEIAETHLAKRDEDHLGAALVRLLGRLALEERGDVRDDDGRVRARLRGLLLLLSVDDVARGEHARVARDLEELVHLHSALDGDDVRTERGDEACGGGRAECLYLCERNRVRWSRSGEDGDE